MEVPNTETLRTLAPTWNLAGDNMLLTLLQNTHQKLLSKCQEINTNIEQMTSTLNDASLDLQNVNNKFMSLSNRQFIESRVYDDDADLTTHTQTNKEPSKPQVIDDLNMLKNGLAILESKHETTEIIDDSDSDSDVEISVVLKPKDIYSHRPLPYIIGSQQFKNKWHVGLIIESDSDSIHSKEQSNVEYSDSELEDIQTDRHHDNNMISESSSLESDRDGDRDRDRDRGQDRAPPQLTAAEIAANIATVMAKTQPLIERPVTPPSPKEYIQKKPPAIYKPIQPIVGTVFPDEPPLLENYIDSSDEGDIFSEINRNKPYNQGVKVQSGVTEDLFGKKETEDDFGGPYDEDSPYFRDEPPPIKQLPLKTESKSVEPTQNVNVNVDENTSKKPIGGISLFGSNKNTDTIGAAILKRNRRKSSTSDDNESDVTKEKTNMAPKKQNIDEIDNKKVEKDIFDDLFAKNNVANTKNVKTNKKDEKIIVNTKNIQKDLFSDNIFDDVDDIFKSDIKITSNTAKQSLFDDDDDLFNDIPQKEDTKKKDTKPETVKSKLFDSDDELFNDIKTKVEEKITPKTVHLKQEDIIKTADKHNIVQEDTKIKSMQPKQNITIFDSDSDEDIFNFNKSPPKSSIEIGSTKSKPKAEETKKFQRPSLFDDDDELFNETNKIDPIPNVIANKIKSQTEHLLVIEKDAINTESQSTKSLETNTDTNILNKTSSNVSDKGIATLKPEAEVPKLTEPTSINNEQNPIAKNIPIDVNNVTNILETPKNTKSEEIIEEKTLEQEQNTLNSNNETDIVQNDNKMNKAKETLLPKPEVPLFDGEDDVESFEGTKELNKSSFDRISPISEDKVINTTKRISEVAISGENTENITDKKLEIPFFEDKTENITKETQEMPIFEDETQKITKKTPEMPIFENETENITKETPEMPIFKDETENITNKTPEMPIFEDETENITKETPEMPIFNNIPNEIPPEIPIFDDIVTEPPIFEKPKEPKRSKNVNALFDDDSEDEALFFKKNDIISDEKPEVFTTPVNFGIFADEPPPDDTENDVFGSKSEINIPTKQFSQNLFDNDSDDDIFSFKASTSQIQKSKENDLNNDLFTNNIQHTETKTNITENETTTNKIGKITTNVNINVQALVPGASPKKNNIKKDETETKIVKSNTEPKMVKSVSFEDEPEREVLDNNACKHRARIQVKRNPSSRQARHDAIRKSALDLHQDFEKIGKTTTIDIENATKLSAKDKKLTIGDNIPKSKPTDEKQSVNVNNNQKLKDNHESTTDFENIRKLEDKNLSSRVDTESNPILSSKDETIIDKDKTETSEIREIQKADTKLVTENILPKTNAIDSEIPQSQNQKDIKNTENIKEKSTKVVYVLNDEDIFTNPTKNGAVKEIEARDTKINKELSKIEDKTDKIDDQLTQEIKTKDNITKIEKNQINTDTKKISLFDSDDDSNETSLFSTKTTKKHEQKTKKTKLFDSDSDDGDDLFGKKKSNVKSDKVVKKSLFDDDDGDLFGAKPKAKLDNIPKASTSVQTATTSKPIFADPLSLFGDDDD